MDSILDAPTTSTRENAGFWLRLAAVLIDGILLMIVQSIVIFATGGDFQTPSAVASIINVIIGIAYFAGMESSAKQATFGKQAVGIMVTDLDGNRITPLRAVGRYLAKILSGIILLIGYIMALFTEKKQALHDIIASTLVVKK